MRSADRFEPIARRSSSASAGGEAGDVDRHLHQLLLEQRHARGCAPASAPAAGAVGRLLPPVARAGCRGAPSRPGSGRAGSARPRRRGRRTRAASAAAASPSARGSRPGTRRPSRRRRACRRPPGRPAGAVPRSRSRPWCSATRSTACAAARSSMPRPEQVELHQPDRARSRPCPTAARCVPASAPTRPGTRRRPAGRRSPCRRSGCPRWRGEVEQLLGELERPLRGMSCVGELGDPRPSGRSACSTRPAGRASARAPWPCRAPPSAAGSVMTFATCAARCRAVAARRRAGSPPRGGRTRCRGRCRGSRPAPGRGTARTAGRTPPRRRSVMPQRVADRGVRGRAAALAQDPVVAAELRDLATRSRK